jgi:hypothetical protein
MRYPYASARRPIVISSRFAFGKVMYGSPCMDAPAGRLGRI